MIVGAKMVSPRAEDRPFGELEAGDIAVIAIYFAGTLAVGFWVSSTSPAMNKYLGFFAKHIPTAIIKTLSSY